MKHSIRACAGLIIVLILVTPALRAGEPARTHHITLDDYFTRAFIAVLAISPDGNSVACAEGRWQSTTNDRKTDLWMADAGTGEAPLLRGLSWFPPCVSHECSHAMGLLETISGKPCFNLWTIGSGAQV